LALPYEHQSIATSDFHPHVAVGAADGSCQTTNLMKSTRKSEAVVGRHRNQELGISALSHVHQPFFIHKIFQMDYNRTTGEYRMLENFLPYVNIVLPWSL
jgi:transcription factor C subunit 6